MSVSMHVTESVKNAPSPGIILVSCSLQSRAGMFRRRGCASPKSRFLSWILESTGLSLLRGTASEKAPEKGICQEQSSAHPFLKKVNLATAPIPSKH